MRSLDGDGTLLWQALNNRDDRNQPPVATVDRNGNTYTFLNDPAPAGDGLITSFDPAGNVRWTTPISGYAQLGGVEPVRGNNGNAYFALFDGRGFKILGLNTTTGATVLDKPVGGVTNLIAYTGGLALLGYQGDVTYLDYSGDVIRRLTSPVTSSVAPGIATFANAGTDGSVFVAGYTGSCSDANVKLSVTRLRPSGIDWTWDDPTAGRCRSLDTSAGGPELVSLASTPDGGVMLGRSHSALDDAAMFRSISASGALRWTRVAANDGFQGPRGYRHGVIGLPRVDINGLVTLPSSVEFPCSIDGYTVCTRTQVEFASQGSSSDSLPTISVMDPDSPTFNVADWAIDNDRLYMARRLEDGGGTVSALSAPRLAEDYRLALQEALTSSAPSPPPLPPPQPPPPGPPPSIESGSTYVALGDSYSAGEGLKAYEAGTAVANGYPKHAKGNECHRSARAYPQLALQHGTSVIDRRLRACSGGLIDDFSYKRGFMGIAYADDKELYRPEEPAQVSWLGPQTKFVTLSVSGNDLFFAKILSTCAYRRITSPRRPPSQDFIDTCDAQIKRGTTARTKIRRRLKSLYTLVLSRAPNAQIRVLNYPMLFPNPKEYSDKTSYDPALGCVVSGLPAFVLTEHVTKFRGLNRGLNDDIAAAAKAVRSSVPGGGRLGLVDVEKAFGNHTVSCGQSGRPDRPWISAGLIEFPNERIKPSSGSFHPNKTGQCEMALAVNKEFGWKDKKLVCK